MLILCYISPTDCTSERTGLHSEPESLYCCIYKTFSSYCISEQHTQEIGSFIINAGLKQQDGSVGVHKIVTLRLNNLNISYSELNVHFFIIIVIIKPLGWVFAGHRHTHVNIVTSLIWGGCSVYFRVWAKLVLTSKSSRPSFCLSHGHSVWCCEGDVLALRAAQKNDLTQYKKHRTLPSCVIIHNRKCSPTTTLFTIPAWYMV